ncbi:MAG: thiamine-phosphate kinase [Legionella sp.]|nr:thiamine-phosphate kinase [Legionella sp.]
MDEFSLIKRFFKLTRPQRADVIVGIGDDAACLQVSPASHLLISTDTLVANVHFLESWDPYDIACRAVKVNISDMAAMAATPAWISLALTLPSLEETWLERFSQGLHDTLAQWQIALIGGDITRGPLTITFTIHGLAPIGTAVQRTGASAGDCIYVSGQLGAAALAVQQLDSSSNSTDINRSLTKDEQTTLLQKLLQPTPRTDLTELLRRFASAAIDISDGLGADLNHLCQMSQVGARLNADQIPVHPLVKDVLGQEALNLALSGGDDYELCFTIPQEEEANFLLSCEEQNLHCYHIGIIQVEKGLFLERKDGRIEVLSPCGYQHF